MNTDTDTTQQRPHITQHLHTSHTTHHTPQGWYCKEHELVLGQCCHIDECDHISESPAANAPTLAVMNAVTLPTIYKKTSMIQLKRPLGMLIKEHKEQQSIPSQILELQKDLDSENKKKSPTAFAQIQYKNVPLPSSFFACDSPRKISTSNRGQKASLNCVPANIGSKVFKVSKPVMWEFGFTAWVQLAENFDCNWVLWPPGKVPNKKSKNQTHLFQTSADVIVIPSGWYYQMNFSNHRGPVNMFICETWPPDKPNNLQTSAETLTIEELRYLITLYGMNVPPKNGRKASKRSKQDWIAIFQNSENRQKQSKDKHEHDIDDFTQDIDPAPKVETTLQRMVARIQRTCNTRTIRAWINTHKPREDTETASIEEEVA